MKERACMFGPWIHFVFTKTEIMLINLILVVIKKLYSNVNKNHVFNYRLMYASMNYDT